MRRRGRNSWCSVLLNIPRTVLRKSRCLSSDLKWVRQQATLLIVILLVAEREELCATEDKLPYRCINCRETIRTHSSLSCKHDVLLEPLIWFFNLHKEEKSKFQCMQDVRVPMSPFPSWGIRVGELQRGTNLVAGTYDPPETFDRSSYGSVADEDESYTRSVVMGIQPDASCSGAWDDRLPFHLGSGRASPRSGFRMVRYLSRGHVDPSRDAVG